MNIFRPFRRRAKPGGAPGVVRDDPSFPEPEIDVIRYGNGDFQHDEVNSVDEIQSLLGTHPITWVNVEGLGSGELVMEIGKLFQLHPLALEDVVHVHQRAKVEDYGDYLFLVLRNAWEAERVGTEQVSIFLGRNFVVTFQEGHPGDPFGTIRERLRVGQTRICQPRTDYLAHALIDAVIDSYFPIVEKYGARIDVLEDELEGDGSVGNDFVAKIHRLRSDLLLLRRGIWPHREMVNSLLRDGHSLISGETAVYLRDCYDHTIQLIDIAETYRELCSDLRDSYFSKIGIRTNEIMKVLTIISSIFIPLAFIASLYGMNFKQMPELEWTYGYPMALGMMGATAAGLLTFIYRRGWLK